MSAEAGRVTLTLQRSDFDLDVDISVPSRGVIGIYGASGSGKTTLLRCIAGLEQNARGRIVFQHQVWQSEESFLPPWQRPVGYVFQDARLFPHKTVAGNLAFGQRRAAADAGLTSADDVIALFGIAHLLHRRPAGLSAGERQRVAMARALLRAPAVLMMDEPLANLDAARKQDILPFLDRLHASLDMPMVYVSHSLDEIIRLCDHLIVMQAGRVLAQGSLQDTLMRTDLPMLGGREASTLLQVRMLDYEPAYQLSRLQFDGGEMVVPGRHGEPGDALRLRIMASDVSLCLQPPPASSILNILPALVDSLQPEAGGYLVVRLRVGGTHLLARITQKSAHVLGLCPGQSVFAQIKGAAVRSAYAS